MSSLVPVPWQPQYFATPDTFALLVKASELAGHDIPLTDGWRPYATQKALYVGYINHVPGFNLASNPDDPNAQNNHLRGAAFDILNRADRAAMLEAGFTPDAVEWWHFNNPNWRSMPIIKTNTATSALAAVSLDAGRTVIPEEDMTTYYRAVNASTDGRIGKGYIYVQDADGPLRAVDNSEGSVILAKEAKGLVFVADWNGDDIRSLITRVGIHEYEAMPAGLKMTTGTPLQGPGKLTGRIIYDNTSLPEYPKVSVA